ncbi:hypothetical protein ACFFF5_01020 [Lederbergia wuyishanensis]|uniref:LysM domain-containing protein n=1 Tax=Lederbergia wuyishanensis TaxID=1347903 RepID=A0ABU0D1F1_9BACI|nr:hypothetical protein [Lederbergia wuyishanensis]MCJ8006841.1 hypothetical protein [Lederbergia wuyishanensis]MDQ0342225.1 hypothetical protein [Lederbergia wuyishanensis]
MKKIVAFIAISILIYSVYYDLTIGVIPRSSAASSKLVENQPIPVEKEPITSVEIKPGDTVISIIEGLQQGPLPVPISQVVLDFQELNEGIKPEQIQIGKTYQFPVYNQQNR